MSQQAKPNLQKIAEMNQKALAKLKLTGPRGEEIRQQLEELDGPLDIVFTRKEVNELPTLLAENEKIRALASGIVEGKRWLVVCTDRRVLFVDKSWLRGLTQMDVQFQSIAMVTQETKTLLGSIKLSGSGFEMEVESIAAYSVAQLARAIQTAKSELNG